MRLIEQVLLAKELVIAIIDGLNLRDLINVAQTCTTMHGVVLYLLEKYKHQILSPYIRSEHCRIQFFAVLTATRGVITGSCALNMILGSPSYPTNNLNLIVPAGEFDTMAQFLTNGLSFVTGSTTIHRIMRSTIQTFTEFNRLGVHITLAESRDKQDVMRVIVNCPTTADMSFITPGGAATLYPAMTFKSIAYLTDRGKRMVNHEQFGCITSRRFHLERSTQFLGSPCLTNCPVLWRLTKNADEYFIVNWDIRYNIKEMVDNNGLEWCLSKICRNSHCPFRTEIMSQNPTFPPKRAPATPLDVEDETRNIANHQPRYTKIFQGLLFPTNSLRPIIVDIPLRDGVTQLRSLGELEVGYWVNQQDRGPYIGCRNRYRKTFKDVPNAQTRLDHSYTIYTETEHSFPSPNTLLRMINSRKQQFYQQNGNVLLVKSAKEDEKEVVDMNREDISLMTYLLKSILEDAGMHKVRQLSNKSDHQDPPSQL